jgi:polysaccharide pyruvyl transferase CsaB
LKVLHIIGGGDVGGAKTHVISLLAGLTGRIDVSLLSFREGGFAESAREAGINVTVTDGNILSDFKTAKALAARCDILHCHGARANMVGALLKRSLRIPVVTTVHSDYRLDYLGRFFARFSYGAINALSLRRVDYRIGVSDVTTQMLIERGFKPEGLFTIYNGMDFTEAPSGASKRELAARLGLGYTEGDIFAGIAARFDPVKDLSTFVRAAARLKDSCPSLRFVVAGSGPQEAKLRALACQTGARIDFLGWLDGTDTFFELLDINLLTSLSETFPYALTEGARMRCATVATAVGGITLFLDHGINGYLFTPGDDATLAAHIKTLAENPRQRADFAERIYKKAENNFSMRVMLQKQIDIYNSILRRLSRPKNKREGIILCGAYGMDNAGDDAILEAILLQIRSFDPDIAVRVFSRNPTDTKRNYREHTFHTFNLFSFTKAALRSSIYLSGGGNLVQDITSTRSLLFYLFTIFWSHLLGCRILMYGCGIGPITKKRNRKLTYRVLNKCVEAITLRENGSMEELRQLGVTKPTVVLTADPALTLTPAEPEQVESLMLRHGLAPDGKYIAFALRNWPDYEKKVSHIADAADYAYAKYGLTPVYIPIERKQDIRAARLASNLTRSPHRLLDDTGTARVAIGLLSHMQIVVAMRLHALIFAAGQGLPVIGLAYNEKVSAFLRYIGQETDIPFESLTASALESLVDNAVDAIPNRAARLVTIETLRERERLNSNLLGKMLSSERAG